MVVVMVCLFALGRGQRVSDWRLEAAGPGKKTSGKMVGAPRDTAIKRSKRRYYCNGLRGILSGCAFSAHAGFRMVSTG